MSIDAVADAVTSSSVTSVVLIKVKVYGIVGVMTQDRWRFFVLVYYYVLTESPTFWRNMV